MTPRNGEPLQVDGVDVLQPLWSVAPAGVEAERRVSELGPDGRVWEFGLELRSTGDLALSMIDALRARLDLSGPDRWRATWFEAAWGAEFAPVDRALDLPFHLSVSSGRSSHGAHPWLGLYRPGAAIVISVAWSGNWHISIDAFGLVTAGPSSDAFRTVVSPSSPVTAPGVLVAVGRDLDDASSALARAIARDVVPRSSASDAMPVEWNHWWPYEDADINEDVFRANVEIASDLGIDVATLDAGWFGRPAASSDWQRERGDWDEVNTARFPSGLRRLAEETRSRGVGFGIWLEPEALGVDARLRRDRPDIVARRRTPAPAFPSITVSLDETDPSFLGYVCLGSPGGREVALDAMSRVIETTGARWLKLDFNVDPGAGCDRTDHGHGAHDGLFRHYLGLYAVLDEFRARHPEVILEACSSGGLRIDAGLAAHVHCFFLSDPDWTEHHLQVLWGASLLLPPSALLHWSWSQWRGDNPDQDREWSTLTVTEFAAMLRPAMLQRFGVSLRLPDLRPELRACLRDHVTIYRERVAPLVRDGELHRLTAQPERNGGGERVPSFQLSGGDRHVVIGVVLSGGTTPSSVPVIGLDPVRDYIVTDADADGDADGGAGGEPCVRSGGDLLADGHPLRPGSTSWLLLIDPA